MHKIFFCFLLQISPLVLALDGYGEMIFISEIFANAPGHRQNSAHTWIEIANLSDKQIKISHLELKISSESSQPLILERELYPSQVWENFLIIANQADLGLGLSFRPEILVLDFPELSMPTKQDLKICLRLNYELEDCVSLTKKAKFYDGVSLYRPLPQVPVPASSLLESPMGQPWWWSEPCMFINSIFATPGLAERACLSDPDFSREIILDNPLSSAIDFQLLSLPENKSKPILSHLNLSSYVSRSTWDLSFNDLDQTDIWNLKACVSQQLSSKLCYELPINKSVVPGKDISFEEPAWLPQWGEQLRITVRDLSGLSDQQTRSLVLDSLKPPESPSIPVCLSPSGSESWQLKLGLGFQQLPVNYQVQDQSGLVLLSGAWIEAGAKSLNFTYQSQQSGASLWLVLNRLGRVDRVPLTPRGSCFVASGS